MAKPADVTSEVESRMDALKNGVKELIDRAPERATELRKSAMTGAKQGIDAIAVQIKRHPIAALAIAFGVGFLAMRLIRR